MTSPILELSRVSKSYQGLRPLRIERLAIVAGEQIAILGWDRAAAEVFVSLVTGATLPDSGEVSVFGRSTASIGDDAEWLTVVDRFGIVSERAVLLDALSVIQNLAVPFTLDIEPPPDDIRCRAAALAREAGLPEATWERPIAELDAARRVRVRLARAVALDPAVLLLEHPSAGIPCAEVVALGREIRGVAERRGAALLAITAEEAFAGAVASRVLMSDAATGRLSERGAGWWSRRRHV